MIRSFEIRNFRCFQNLELSSLDRVNLLVGANNVGKTSILEALFLNFGAQNPTLSVRLNALRGIEKFTVSGEEIWGWLFHDKRVQEPIQLNAYHEAGIEQRLTIRLGTPKEFELRVSQQTELLLPAGSGSSAPIAKHPSLSLGMKESLDLSELTFEFRDSNGQSVESRAFLTSDGELKFEPAKIQGLRKASFQSTNARHLKENAAQFSRLRATGRQGEVVAALRSVDDRLQSLDILVIGGEPVIHGDIGGEQLIPLPMMGEGFNRILSITLAILDSPGGAVLIDEIENGLHYAALQKLWSAILTAAESADVQIFATSHSRECINAAHEVFSVRPQYALSVIQLFRLSSGPAARVLDGNHISAGMAGDIELR